MIRRLLGPAFGRLFLFGRLCRFFAIFADVVAVILGRAGLFAFHNFQHLIAFYGFPFNQGAGHGFHLVAVFIQDFVGNRILLVQNPTDFGIHILLGFLGNILRTCNAAAQKHLTLVFGIHHHTHVLAHAVASNHFPGNLGGTFEVVGRAGGNAADKQVFGNAPAEQNRNLVQHLVFIHADAVAFRQLPC